ncbi:MAG: UDP-glucose/GDP-mannose dehydrogenase family protein [Candidatus Aenigmarchaeota archaeon]|nr:UDP-glucose/GDP-mannose dehydrogenase family protein [Candidatus Aenigmarchaeota archaeon]
MNISVIGTGYVGLCTGVVFATKGHHVTCVEIDKEKIALIRQGKSPIYEEQLEDLLTDVMAKKMFAVTDDLARAVLDTELSIIAVGTPSKNNGAIDLSFIECATCEIGCALKQKNTFHTIIVKSTVLPGTTEQVVKKILEQESGKKAGKEFGLCMVPEFLREGKAVEDALHPYRIVIGALDNKSAVVADKLYYYTNAPLVCTDLRTAEMIKYASNAFLATKISFINELGNLCKQLGIDTYDVAHGMGFDERIGRKFLDAGCGFGGSCFGKDVRALLAQAHEVGVPMQLIPATLAVNEKQPLKMIDILQRKIPDLKNKKIAVLGLAFKAGTDDIRDAPSLSIIHALVEAEASVTAHDPKAVERMKKQFPQVTYARTVVETLKNADACLILADWPEYKKLSDADFSSMKTKIIIEGRKILNPEHVANFEGVCW